MKAAPGRTANTVSMRVCGALQQGCGVFHDDFASAQDCEATHHGEFMGISPTGKRIKIPYIDFWRVENGKIAENRVSVDFPAILAQLGHDIFNGKGWDKLDSAPAKNASLSFA